MADVSKLDPYVECVVKHRDGTIRVGRLNHNKSIWQMSTFQTCKYGTVWSNRNVVSFKVIDLNI